MVVDRMFIFGFFGCQKMGYFASFSKQPEKFVREQKWGPSLFFISRYGRIWEELLKV